MKSSLNSLGAAAARCNMKDSGGMKKVITIMASLWSRILYFDTPAIFQVAVGHGCARVCHAAIYAAAQNNALKIQIIILISIAVILFDLSRNA